jgi:hypothetical protein
MFNGLTREDQIIYGTLLVVGLLLALIIWWGIGVRKEQDTQSRDLTVEAVMKLVGDRLYGDRFLWCIWQGLLSASEFRLHVKDEKGRELTVLTVHHIPKGRVIKEYEWAGRHLEYFSESLLSTRMLLRDAGSGEVLYSCRRETFLDIFYQGLSDHEICRVPSTSVLKDYRPVLRNDHEIGRLLMPEDLRIHLPVLTLENDTLPTDQQLFLLAGLLGKS